MTLEASLLTCSVQNVVVVDERHPPAAPNELQLPWWRLWINIPLLIKIFFGVWIFGSAGGWTRFGVALAIGVAYYVYSVYSRYAMLRAALQGGAAPAQGGIWDANADAEMPPEQVQVQKFWIQYDWRVHKGLVGEVVGVVVPFFLSLFPSWHHHQLEGEWPHRPWAAEPRPHAD